MNPVINQFHTHVAPGDAITQQMLWIRDTLKTAGIDGEIYATSIAPEIPALLYEGQPIEDNLFIHHSQYNPQLKCLLDQNNHKAIIYHNITPASFYGHDRTIQSELERGRHQLEELQNINYIFADSQFNLNEIPQNENQTRQIFPLLDVAVDKQAATNLSDTYRTLLFVGRLAPHKKQDQLLDVLAEFNRFTDLTYRLKLIGSGDPIYRLFIEKKIKYLGLEDAVELQGRVSDSELEAAYTQANAYLSLSAHEGFGIPLVEAMQNQLPVFARSTPGIEETMGNSGVLLHSDDPLTIAQVVHAALSCDLAPVLGAQHDQLKNLATIHNPTRMISICRKFLENGNPNER